MWLFLDDANLSISRHTDRPGMLMIRARTRDSLVAAFPDAAIEHTPKADYPYRTVLPDALLIAMFAACVGRMTYGEDVKNVVDHHRMPLYRDLWVVTRGHQGGG